MKRHLCALGHTLWGILKILGIIALVLGAAAFIVKAVFYLSTTLKLEPAAIVLISILLVLSIAVLIEISEAFMRTYWRHYRSNNCASKGIKNDKKL